MYDNDLIQTLAQKLLTDFKRHESHANLQIGKVTIYVNERRPRDLPKDVVVDVGCNWPAIGTVDPDQTAQFATDLQNAAVIAREAEKKLFHSGYLIYRSL